MDVGAANAIRSDGTSADDMAQRIVLGALLLELLVLAATGVALFFVYRPAAPQGWTGAEPDGDLVVTAVRTAHRVVSSLTVLTAAAAVVVFVATSARKRTWAVAGALVGAVLAASFTGYLLPWDQLALWAVTVGEGLSGYRPMFSERVRFVLIGGTEVGPDTVVRWLGVHGVVLGPLAFALVLVLARWRRRSRQAVG